PRSGSPGACRPAPSACSRATTTRAVMPMQTSPPGIRRMPLAHAERAAGRVSAEGLLTRLASRLDRRGENWVGLLSITLSPVDRRLAIEPENAARRILQEVETRLRELLHPDDRFAFVSREEVWILLARLPAPSVAE